MNGKTGTAHLDAPDNWDWGNEVLYRMCREELGHTKLGVIAGKVWLIGRAIPLQSSARRAYLT